MDNNSNSFYYNIYIGIAVVFFLFQPLLSFGQKQNWQNLDLREDGVFGISTEKAYRELLKNKKGIKVKIAVLDGGVDILHEDLSDVIWFNTKEVVNGKDDDKNGYTDDVNGWNFLGSSKGSVTYDNLELTRQVRYYSEMFRDKDTIALKGEDDYERYLELRADLENKKHEAVEGLLHVVTLKHALDSLVLTIGKEQPDAADFDSLETKDGAEKTLISFLGEELKERNFANFYDEVIIKPFVYYKDLLQYQLNEDFNSRDTVGDNYNDPYERFYGNPDVAGPDALHGTHVAGIIAAVRDNEKGIYGVGNMVEIIPVRCVPNGDERDKDVANAIRYAVDAGAKIINMSFGKSYSTHKNVVDAAVKYAMSKDVLLIHAAGNDNVNVDLNPNFPSKFLDGGEIAEAWLEVGASSWHADSTLKSSFSNYGKKTVDVFAPGAKIMSTVPGSKYEEQSGTSMAAPVVAGMAGIIRSYYPDLTAVQVKDIIMKTVVPFKEEVVLEDGEKIPFSELSVSGGVVNVYDALKLAEEY